MIIFLLLRKAKHREKKREHEVQRNFSTSSRFYTGAKGKIMNCWEYKQCGREKGGIHAERKGICPAYPAHGKGCARVAGTLCGGKVQGEFVMKLLSCIKCDFYQSEHYDKSYGKEKEIV